MAQRVTTSLIDDLDGNAAEETIEFELDGRGYEIDLSRDNAAKLREALAGFVASARKKGRGTRHPAAGRAPARADREQNQAIREWAQRRGLKVSERGRIPAEVLAAHHEWSITGNDPLSTESAEPLHDFATYEVEPAVATNGHPTGITFGSTKERDTAIRDWAASKGINVAPRGAIKRVVVNDFVQEHGPITVESTA